MQSIANTLSGSVFTKINEERRQDVQQKRKVDSEETNRAQKHVKICHNSPSYEQNLDTPLTQYGENATAVTRCSALHSLFEHDKAIEYYQQMLDFFKVCYGDTHPSVAKTLHCLGTSWYVLGKHERAIACYEHALLIQRSFYMENHPDVIMTTNNLRLAWTAFGEDILLQNDPKQRVLALTNKNIEDAEAQSLANALRINQTLQTLRLIDNQIGPRGAEALANTLRVNQTLQTLNLSHNQITEAGAQAFAIALAVNQTLRKLYLPCNHIGKSGIQALATALTVNHFLQTLVLDRNQIGDVGAQALATALEKNQSLQALHLISNQIGITGVQALANSLKSNQTLQKLVLNCNQIGDVGAQALGTALKVNQSLQKLELAQAQIGDVGMQALVVALKDNPFLTKLGIKENYIGDKGAQALGSFLQVNQTLQQLNLKCNQISDVGALAMATALEENQTLQQLNISQNNIKNAEVEAQIATLLQANTQMATTYYNRTKTAAQRFIRSNQNQPFDEKRSIIHFQKDIQLRCKKIETLLSSLEKIAIQSGRTLNRKCKKDLKGILDDLMHLFNRPLDQLHKELMNLPFEKISNGGDPALARNLYQIWVKIFGRKCPEWLITYNSPLKDEVLRLLQAMMARSTGELVTPSATLEPTDPVALFNQLSSLKDSISSSKGHCSPPMLPPHSFP